MKITTYSLAYIFYLDLNSLRYTVIGSLKYRISSSRGLLGEPNIYQLGTH